MADAKREHEYDIAIATIGYLNMAIGGEIVGQELNPYRCLIRSKTKEEIEDDTITGFGFLRRGLLAVMGR